MSKVVFISGWGYPKNYFQKALKLSSEKVLNFSWNEIQEKSEIVIEKLGDSKIILVGFSLGGWLLPSFLSKYSHLKVEKVILIGVGLSFTQTRDNPYGVPLHHLKLMERELVKDPKLILEQFHQNSSGLSRDWKMEGDLSKDALLKGLRLLREVTMSPYLPKTPIYLIHGKKDSILSWKNSLLLGGYLPHGKVILVEDALHDISPSDLGKKALLELLA